MYLTTEYHNPVLLKEAVDGLNIRPDGVYVDVTFGGGGHSREILSRLGPEGKLFGFDQDSDALKNAIDDARFVMVDSNFRYMKRFLRFYGHDTVDGVLADFGVSSHQFDVAERGFSTRFDADLDMRMDREGVLSAKTVVDEYDEEGLRAIFSEYGELRNAAALAKAIVEARKQAKIKTTVDLKEALQRFLPPHRQHKILAQIYQAIRIEVNQELEALKILLLQTVDVLEKGGRISLMSYHSLEDRLVKRFIRNGMFQGEPDRDLYGRVDVPFKAVGKLIVPTADEISQNSRARSAKLRIGERL